jgi:hypothetical protein
MTTNQQQPTDSGAIDQAAFNKVIRDNMSPEGIAATICFLQIAENYMKKAGINPETKQAVNQVAWFRNTLMNDTLGVDEYYRELQRFTY